MWPRCLPPLHRGRIFTTNGVLPFLRRRVCQQDSCSLWISHEKKGKKKREGYLRWRARGETISRKCSWNVVLRGDGAVAFIADASFRFDGPTRDSRTTLVSFAVKKENGCVLKWHVNGAHICGNRWPETRATTMTHAVR